MILPLSIPGIFAGFLLTFIPAVGDYVNNDILGGTNTTMIGNIVQREFLNDQNYPLASRPGVHPDDRADDRDPDLRPRPRDAPDRGVRVSAGVAATEPRPRRAGARGAPQAEALVEEPHPRRSTRSS